MAQFLAGHNIRFAHKNFMKIHTPFSQHVLNYTSLTFNRQGLPKGLTASCFIGNGFGRIRIFSVSPKRIGAKVNFCQNNQAIKALTLKGCHVYASLPENEFGACL